MIKLGAVSGILGVVIFFAVAVLLEQFLWQSMNLSTTEQFLAVHATSPFYQISIGAHLLMGLAMLCLLVAFLGLQRLLEYERGLVTVKLGIVFGVIACALMVVQGTVQGTVMVKMGKALALATDDVHRKIVLSVYRGLRLLDQGIDLAFDTFFFTAWILLGIAMLRNRFLGKCLGSSEFLSLR
jgi:uncharacterized membrane protein YidH (DUF202 family)